MEIFFIVSETMVLTLTVITELLAEFPDLLLNTISRFEPEGGLVNVTPVERK